MTLALNGRDFCPDNRGVLVVVVAVKWEWAKIADPVTGKFRWVTRQQLESADKHAHGNWMFYPSASGVGRRPPGPDHREPGRKKKARPHGVWPGK